MCVCVCEAAWLTLFTLVFLLPCRTKSRLTRRTAGRIWADDAVHPIIGILQGRGNQTSLRTKTEPVAISLHRRPITEADGWDRTWPSWVRTGLTWRPPHPLQQSPMAVSRFGGLTWRRRHPRILFSLQDLFIFVLFWIDLYFDVYSKFALHQLRIDPGAI